jgi:putative transposase
VLHRLLVEQCRLYNAALEERRGAWRLERRSVTRFDQYRTLTGLAAQEPALMAFGVTVARGTLLRLDRAFQAFFRRARAGERPGFPRFRSWRRFDSVEWPDARGWKLDEGSRRLYLQGVGQVKLRLHRPLRGMPRTITVRRLGRRWQVTVFCVDVPAQPLPATGVDVGLDVGVTHLAALSTGELVDNPRHLRSSEERLARAQRLVAGRTRGSARRRSAAGLLGVQHRTIANQRRDFLHKLSRSLVNDHDLIAIEDLRITNMTRRPKPRPDGDGAFAPNGAAAKGGLNKSILDAGWATLLAMLTYKAEDAGRQLVAVNPRYTSQTCPLCGLVDVANRHGTAFQCIGCGHSDHADVNAAVNILRAGQALRLEREANRAVA